MSLWEDEMLQVLLNSDFGWLGNIIPLMIVVGCAWGLSTKDVDFTLSLFPLMVCAKVIFPFLHPSFVVISFALFIMNIIGSKGDLLAEVKVIPELTQSFRKETYQKAKSGLFGLVKTTSERMKSRTSDTANYVEGMGRIRR